ncbi:MAG: zinc metallopeptidase [Defluviitaleaceae bacterium]|nr:zinc metallopeptidase [Defluviitaleaceae bacterium]
MPFIPFLYFDLTFVVLIPAIIVAMIANQMIKSNYIRYVAVYSRRDITGAEAARKILASRGIHDVAVEKLAPKNPDAFWAPPQRRHERHDNLDIANLKDHYDPRSRTVRLSELVYESTSLSALAIAAHEAGHAVQHAESYAPLMLRKALVPVVNFTSRISIPLFFTGIALGAFIPDSYIGIIFMQLAILFFGGVVLFQLVTLPVEFNASKRARLLLLENYCIDEVEVKPIKKILNAAAFTYIAAALTSLLMLLRILLISNRRRR